MFRKSKLVAFVSVAMPAVALAQSDSEVITFSEFPLGTAISSQYEALGIVFGGSGPFISLDGSNPTSPVLSGTPLFQGSVSGFFVMPGTNIPAVVESFTMDLGYFDEFGSTRIEWFDPEGKKLGQKINSDLGIETITVEGGSIASWSISIIENEPAGYAVDNFYFTPLTTSILFREKSGDDKDGTWGLVTDEIPGFDHVGLQVDGAVYESHPGYPAGAYISADGEEAVAIGPENGVQSQHTRNTFEHDSTTAVTPVVDFEEVPIDRDLALSMQTAIQSVDSATFQFIDYSLDGIQSTLSPAAQKGGDNSYTCVGLVEWAAEAAEHNGGEGFIRDSFESFSVPDPRSVSLPVETIEVPLLSPQLLNYAVRSQRLLDRSVQWLQGFLDPVDFVLTDPLGRRLGFISGEETFNEIPDTFFSGDGAVEQFLIARPLPGTYTISFHGLGAEVFAALGSDGSTLGFAGFLAAGEGVTRSIVVEARAGITGDVNGDAMVDAGDITALAARMNRFTDGLGDPGDIDGDGLLSAVDLELLTELVNLPSSTSVSIDIYPDCQDNRINLNSKGVVPVAIFGSSAFDVNDIDLTTLHFGPALAAPKHAAGGHLQDVNKDGFMDLVSHFPVRALGLTAQDAEACVTAATVDGMQIGGCDKVAVRP